MVDTARDIEANQTRVTVRETGCQEQPISSSSLRRIEAGTYLFSALLTLFYRISQNLCLLDAFAFPRFLCTDYGFLHNQCLLMSIPE